MQTEVTHEMLAAGLQPMESAPKDGTVILVLTRDHQITTCKWNGSDWTLNVCGTWATDGDVDPIGWQSIPSDLLALQVKD